MAETFRDLIIDSEENYKEIPEGTPLPEIKNEIEKNERMFNYGKGNLC